MATVDVEIRQDTDSGYFIYARVDGGLWHLCAYRCTRLEARFKAARIKARLARGLVVERV